MSRHVLTWALLLAELSWLAAGPKHAQACSPTTTSEGAPTPAPITLEARTALATAIFEGTVVGHEHGEQYGPAIVEVERYLKGAGPDLVLIDGFGWGADCKPMAEIGLHSVFFTSGDPYGRLSIAPGRPFASLDTQGEATVEALVGHAPVDPSGEHPVLETADWSTKTPEEYRAKLGLPPSTSEGHGEQQRWSILALAGAAFVFGLGLAVWAALGKKTRS